ncbi:DinB family protein [Alicyclobacillus fodiniaquatilis]|uniref:DinB family protein n=1 Tax=Alicyclobacillus fodiniaquatilis TaxID=1661150 RepID=A0ABW4JLZ0_9BACL
MAKAEQFLQSYLMHRNVLGELVATLKDEDVQFSPWDKAMSTGDLIWHMLSSSYSFSAAAATGQFERVTDKPALTTIAEVQSAIAAWTDKTVNNIRSMTDEKFDELVDMTKVFGTQIPAGALLQSMRDHEIHHKGQLFVYARLCGADGLPLFIKRG